MGARSGFPAARTGAGGARPILIRGDHRDADGQCTAEALRPDAGGGRAQPGRLACGSAAHHHVSLSAAGADRLGGDFISDVVRELQYHTDAGGRGCAAHGADVWPHARGREPGAERGKPVSDAGLGPAGTVADARWPAWCGEDRERGSGRGLRSVGQLVTTLMPVARSWSWTRRRADQKKWKVAQKPVGARHSSARRNEAALAM